MVVVVVDGVVSDKPLTVACLDAGSVGGGERTSRRRGSDVV